MFRMPKTAPTPIRMILAYSPIYTVRTTHQISVVRPMRSVIKRIKTPNSRGIIERRIFLCISLFCISFTIYYSILGLSRGSKVATGGFEPPTKGL